MSEGFYDGVIDAKNEEGKTALFYARTPMMVQLLSLKKTNMKAEVRFRQANVHIVTGTIKR